MSVTATAPGKLFLVGEYAVLDGSPALVAAVSARATATIRAQVDARWSLVTRQATTTCEEFTAGEPTGVALLDVVLDELLPEPEGLRPCEILLDTTPFFSPGKGQKRGLGSSAALLVALYGALGCWLGQGQTGDPLGSLRAMHDGFQGGRGSGGDLAASLRGGLIRYRLDAAGGAEIDSVALPDSVGFACICTGQAASSPEFVDLFRRWQALHPDVAAARMGRLDQVAQASCEAVDAGDGVGFLAAVAAYGHLLAELGQVLGAQIITPEHEQLKKLAEQYGVTYKSSGAGGGDMGVAFAQESDRLAAFVAGSRSHGFETLDLAIDPIGLEVKRTAG